MRTKFCEKSIYWVLSYRNSPHKKLHQLYKYGFVDDHTKDTWDWTLRESTVIDKYGLEHWLNNTKGPYGFWFR
jgi:hypothetical protein